MLASHSIFRVVSSVLTLSALALAASGGAARADGPPIEIGLIASQSGPVGDQGYEYTNGVKLAADLINKAGGIAALANRPIHLNVVDDTSTPAVARTLAIKLINDNKVSVIIGPYGTGPCLAAAPVGEQEKRALICSSASDAVTQQGYKYVFNRSTLAGTYAIAAFHVLNGLSAASDVNLKKVAVIYEDGAYGTNGNAQVAKPAAELGIELTDRIAFHTNTPDLSPVVNRAVASGAKALLVLSYTGDGLNILRSVRSMKAPVLVIGSVIWAPAMMKMGQAAEGVLSTSDWNDDILKPAVQTYRTAYKAAYGDYPSFMAAWGWSDMYFLKAALESAASTDPQKLRDVLAHLKITSGPAVDIEPYNSYGFDENGLAIDQLQRVLGAQFQNGRFVTVWPASAATAKFDTSTLK